MGGRPKELVMDRGTQFTSKTWAEYLRGEGIQGVFVPVRHHEANLSERVIRTVGDMLRCVLYEDDHKSWYKWIPWISATINSVPHDTTGAKPVQLQMGTNPLTLWDNVVPPSGALIPSIQEVLEKIKRNREINLKCRNRNRRYVELGVGALVMVENTAMSSKAKGFMSKLASAYDGPYAISVRISESVFEIVDPISRRLKGVFHVNQLWKYCRPRHVWLEPDNSS
uniref:Integrase catalytic domain-containing protein n=1 Tax=Lygus hesperus TaxID=30085 RepID=A0A0K8TDS8_LYGHE